MLCFSSYIINFSWLLCLNCFQNAFPLGLCILRTFLLYVIFIDFLSYAFLFTYLLECLPLWPHAMFLSLCFLNLFFPLCLPVRIVSMSLHRLDCLTLGLYALFLACMPSCSQLSVCLYLDFTALLLAYMSCSCPVCPPVRHCLQYMSLYRLDCLLFGLYALFLACMPSSSPLSVYVFIYRLDCLTLGLYALFLACMSSSSQLSVCLYIDLTALLLAYMPCSWPVCPSVRHCLNVFIKTWLPVKGAMSLGTLNSF
jgi:hypothetical protein